MSVLVIDTCLAALTLGIKLEDGTVVSVSEDIGIGHAERIAPAFSALADEAGVEPKHLQRIGVTVGPGSFMGQRVGIAFAKGLMAGCGAEPVPMTTLEALAASVPDPAAASLIAVDARRGEIYLQRFGDGRVAMEPCRLVSAETAGHEIQASGLPAFGSGVAPARAAAGLPSAEDPGPSAPTALGMLSLATTRPSAPLRTLYLRAPDAKAPSRPAL
ncbi:MAG: tRNA (adenosine(37)-N6)-threonylcarbamoyltransferase complex dimerization subunit type 1 TsaB [Pseudomonadota bacterium]